MHSTDNTRKMEKHNDGLDVMEENHNDTAANGTTKALNSQRDLLAGLSEEAVLGEVIPPLSQVMPSHNRQEHAELIMGQCYVRTSFGMRCGNMSKGQAYPL